MCAFFTSLLCNFLSEKGLTEVESSSKRKEKCLENVLKAFDMESGNSFLNNVRVVVKSTLVARGGQMTIELLEKDYNEWEYEHIPFRKLGFTSTEALLRSFNDFIRVQGHGRSAVVQLLETGNSKTKHLQEMIKAQKPDRKFREKLRRSAGRGYNVQRNRSFVNSNAPQYPMPVANVAPRFPYQLPAAMIPTTVLMNMSNPYMPQQQPPQFGASACLDGRGMNQTPTRPPAPPIRQKTPPPPLQRPSPVKRVPSPIRKIISAARKTPPPVRTSPPRIKKLPSPIKKILSSSRIRTPSPERRTPSPVERTSIVASKSAKTLPVTPLDDFGEFDWSTTCPPPGFRDDDQPGKDMRNAKMDEIEAQIEDLTLTSLQGPSETFSVPDNDAFSVSSTNDEPAFPEWVYELCQFVPKDMAGYKEIFKENKRTDVLKIGGWRQIFVTEVHNPHKFFFQTEVEQQDFENVMKDLRIMYCKQSSDELQPREHEVKRNMVVAVLYDHIWHRGRVISEPFLINKVCTVKVHYVDFGTVHSVRLEDVRFLHKSFLETPILCHRASLSGILPHGSSWTLNVTKFFLAHVTDRSLMAFAQAFHAPDRSWHVELVDPAKKPVVNITMELINENLADDYDTDGLEEYMSYYKSHPPTFDDLINGHFPTYSELLEYSRVGIEFEPENANGAEGEGEEKRMVLYLNETNPFIECLRERNIQVITIPRPNVDTFNPPSFENDLSICERTKDAPMDNFNIPIVKRHRNPFLVDLSDD